jgi:hypothetical protein
LIEGLLILTNAVKGPITYEYFIKPNKSAIKQTIVDKLKFLLSPFEALDIDSTDRTPTTVNNLTLEFKKCFLKTEEEVMSSFFSLPMPVNFKNQGSTFLSRKKDYLSTQEEVSNLINPC